VKIGKEKHRAFVYFEATTEEERRNWNMALFFARGLADSAIKMYEYLIGKGGDPTHAFQAQKLANELALHVQAGLSIRLARCETERKQKELQKKENETIFRALKKKAS